MDPRKALLEARIRSVKAGFVAALPEKGAAIAGHWRTLRHNGWDDQEGLELQRLAHNLAGSGGTFGFPEVSRTARELDISLGKILRAESSTRNIRPETILKLEEQVDSLLLVIKDALVNQDSPADTPVLTQIVAGPGKSVVVIDDDPFLRERMSALLEAAGYQVTAFETPAKAIPYFQEHQPAMVLLDLMFPGRRGPAFEVIAHLRGETGQRTPVAVISGHADFRSRMEATRAGADAYLAKPLEESRLLEVAAQLTDRRLDDGWRCLVIDDDEAMARQVAAWLCHAGLTAEWVTSPADSWLKVREFHPDVIVMDINMPEYNGIELATMLRQDAETTFIPIVFLTSDTDTRVRRQAMAVGADDYLLKPVDRLPLVQAVLAQARLGKRVQGRVSRLSRQAGGGGLSRHFFFNRLEWALDEAGEGMVRPALVLLALVEAPKVLETHGVLGMAALQQLWQERLEGLEEDVWTLLGENIVGLLLPRDTPSGHRMRVSAILSRLAVAPYSINGQEIASSACAAILNLRQGKAPAAVLLQAEQALGLALDGEPGTVIEAYVGDAGPIETSGTLPTDRLRVVYQAIATLDEEGEGNCDPVKSVLVRLADADGQLLPAGSLLADLEKSGLLPELDAWLLRQAHRILTSQIDAAQGLTLVVSASPQSLGSAVYLETLRALIAMSPMRNPRQRLVVAISEASAITHRSQVERLAALLQELGLGLMVNGYGGSINAAAILEQLRPLYARLDEGLGRRLEKTGEYLADDRALLETAEALGVTVVAGGIERAASLSGLWAKGIRWFQGYYIHEPESAPVSVAETVTA